MLARIEDGEPETWEDLEIAVARILSEAGLRAERGKSLTTARGSVNADVYAEDDLFSPPAVTLFECKHWKRPLPQTVIHAFRTVIADSGANTGMIISVNGFQSGAEDATRFSNIHLVDWDVFQALFAERWYRNYMMRQGRESLDPLIQYTEPINSRIFRKADSLPKEDREAFKNLRKKYAVPAMTLIPIFFSIPDYSWRTGFPALPMRQALANINGDGYFSDAILDATSLRGFLNAVIAYANAAVSEFDALFDSRA